MSGIRAAGARPPRRAGAGRGAIAASRSTRPAATSRGDAAQRDRPRGARSKDVQPRRRASAATAAADGPSRSPVSRAAVPEHGDHPPLDRHRALELDQLLGDRHASSASHGSGRRRDPQARVGAHRPGRSPGRRGSASWNGRRSSSTPVAKRIRAIALGRRLAPSARARRTARGRAPAARRRRGPRSPPRCSSRCSDAPRRRVRPSAEPPPSRNGHGGTTSTRSSIIRPRRLTAGVLVAAQEVDVDQERVARDDLAQPALGLACACGAAPGARRRLTTATVAAPATKPGRRQRGRLAGGHGGGQRRLDDRAGRPATGQPVDDLAPPGRPPASRSRTRQHDGSARTIARRPSSARARARRRPEHPVPVRRADAEAALVVLEVVAHVQLAQPPPDRRCAARGGALRSGPCRRPGSPPRKPAPNAVAASPPSTSQNSA